MDKQGYIPIYCRITIDGIDDEISTGLKVLYADWDTENKQVLSAEPAHKAYNKKLRQMETDLEWHSDLVVAQKGLATPKLVFDSYRTPLNGHQQKTGKKRTLSSAYSWMNCTSCRIDRERNASRAISSQKPMWKEVKMASLYMSEILASKARRIVSLFFEANLL